MSDIGFSNLDWIIWTIVALCFIGPPLLLWAIFFAIGIFVRRKKVLMVGYLVTSTVVSGGVLLWLADWQNWPWLGMLAFPMGLGMTVGCTAPWASCRSKRTDGSKISSG